MMMSEEDGGKNWDDQNHPVQGCFMQGTFVGLQGDAGVGAE